MVVNESAPIIGQHVMVNGISMYYLDEGSGTPYIVLPAGSTDDLQPLIRRYREFFRVLAVDLRGHGRSDNPSGEMTYSLMADDVAAFITALELEGPIVSGGSDGGQIALELAAHHLGLASALVIGGAWFRFTETYYTALRETVFLEPGKVDIERLERERPGFVAGIRAQHRHVYGEDYWKTLLQIFSRLYFTPLDLTPEGFAAITIPSLLVLGDRDPFIPVEEAVAMYRMMPAAELAIVPAVGHGASTAAQRRIVTHIELNFLERHGFLQPPLEWSSSRGE
jgi:pimeloyl-ACP methyl ester carboxylesterase